MIFHYRYMLDTNNDIIRERRFDQASVFTEVIEGEKRKDKKGTAFRVEIKEKAKMVDPQIKVNCVMAKLFQNHMQANASKWPAVRSPFVGFPCAVKWRKDNVWYRAVVVKVLHGDKAKTTESDRRSVVVQFVDFGNRDFAEIADLKLLPTDALIPPALATRAKVHGLRNEFGKTVFDFVHSNTVEKPLHGVLKGTWKDEVSGQVVPELTVWKKETQKFALKKLVDVGLLDYAPCYEERGYMKAKDREMVKM